MKHFFALLLVISSLVASGATVFAHSGGTDANGCHHETKTGGYHCH